MKKTCSTISEFAFLLLFFPNFSQDLLIRFLGLAEHQAVEPKDGWANPRNGFGEASRSDRLLPNVITGTVQK